MSCSPVTAGGWNGVLIDKGYKLLLLDQRGTGMSNTITADFLAKQGDAKQQATYLKLFRADSIVRDAEAIRKALTKNYPEETKKWSILGQSFGGFCCVNYLSRFPEGLREVFITGGLPPLVKEPFPVYQKLSQKVEQRSLEYYEKFPEDVHRVQAIARYLRENQVKTHTGGFLTPHRLQALGIILGFHRLGLEGLHNLILRMWNDLEMFGSFTRPTIQIFDDQGSFDTSILYALLHEACYLNG